MLRKGDLVNIRTIQAQPHLLDGAAARTSIQPHSKREVSVTVVTLKMYLFDMMQPRMKTREFSWTRFI
ncbi:hypothetical protein VTI28DRAFT_2289 [Corynascus sepedonium]